LIQWINSPTNGSNPAPATKLKRPVPKRRAFLRLKRSQHGIRGRRSRLSGMLRTGEGGNLRLAGQDHHAGAEPRELLAEDGRRLSHRGDARVTRHVEVLRARTS